MYTKFTPEEIAQQEKAAKIRRDMIFGGKSQQKNNYPDLKSGILFVGMINCGAPYFLWSRNNRAWICNGRSNVDNGFIHTVHDYTAEAVLADHDLIFSSAIDSIGKIHPLASIDFWKVVPDQERPDWVKELFLGKL